MSRAKHKNDGNHGKRGWVGGNPRYSRSKLSRMLNRGERIGDGRAKRNVTMGKN